MDLDVHRGRRVHSSTSRVAKRDRYKLSVDSLGAVPVTCPIAPQEIWWRRGRRATSDAQRDSEVTVACLGLVWRAALVLRHQRSAGTSGSSGARLGQIRPDSGACLAGTTTSTSGRTWRCSSFGCVTPCPRPCLSSGKVSKHRFLFYYDDLLP